LGRHSPAARPHPRPPVVDARTKDIRLSIEKTQKIYPNGRRARTLGTALLITFAATVLPGSGHLLMRRRVGWFILGGFVALLAAAALFVLKVPYASLLEYALSPEALGLVMLACAVAAALWLTVILGTYRLARPRSLGAGHRILGGFVVLVLGLGVTAPFGFAAYTANSQRDLLNTLFPSGGGADGSKAPAGDINAIKKSRINIFLVGSDAGEGRIGTRTDTMVVASLDTRTGRTILLSLPRNMAFAQFPPNSPMAQRFPNGFNDPDDAASGLLNGVYLYGNEHPEVAPKGPSNTPGLNLLMSSIGHILGLQLDYYIQVNMDGFAAIIDALGGIDVNVGPEPVPIGGIGPFGEEIRPRGYIPAGQQHLTGEQALWFARSRKNSSDYVRMGRQRCLMQYMLDQKSPMDVLRNFQAVASATKDSVATNIPQEILPALVTLAEKAKARPMESIAFDPSLPDPSEPDGKFNTGNPNYQYVRQVVRDVIEAPPATTSTSAAPPAAPTSSPPTGRTTTKPSKPAGRSPQPTSASTPTAPAPTSLGEACSATAPN
jgi:polyisoprenyl-teichoic acid--peptidoglycan teichoic acid transferase